jgi:hypothetical protein
MKKWLVFVISVWVSGILIPAMAQHIAFGFRGGLNLSNVEISDPDEMDPTDTKNRPGLFVGLATEVGLSDYFALQPEFQYTQYGFKVEESFEGGTLKFDMNYNYLQIPVLAKFTIGSERAGFQVMAGPHFGFGIGDIKMKAEMLNEKEEETMSWDDAEIDRFDMGFNGGIGLFAKLGPGKVGMDVRYLLGLQNINTVKEESSKVTNRNLQVGLSYLIPLFR